MKTETIIKRILKKIKDRKQLFAFTLAETLLTLVIIGVIAGMTIPLVIGNVDEQVRSARVKKVYSTYAKAFTMARAFGADMLFEEVDKSQEKMNDWYDEFLKKNLNTYKVCYDTPGCWNSGDVFSPE